MSLGLGHEWPFLFMEILHTTSSDPVTIAAVEAFNVYFSLTFMFGYMAFLCTAIFTIMARS